MNLEDFGWNPFFQQHLSGGQGDSLVPARVIFQGRGLCRLLSEAGELWADVGGALRYDAASAGAFPVCGDWVMVDDPRGQDRTVIRRVLPRKSSFSRKQAGTAVEAQVVAANVDVVCLVSGLDADFNPRRIERYLAVAWESGARPVILLNKADLCPDVDLRLSEAMSVAPGVPVLAVSAIDGNGLEELLGFLQTGATLAFLGSSGVGKSSIVNRLLGRSAQEVHEIDDSTGRGMHTTTSRQLFALPSGGLVMDTPGMRELQLWSVDSGLGAAFHEIETLAAECRFRDCTHEGEPGCRVREMVDRGELDAGRLANYFKLRKEASYVEQKVAHSASWVEKERWKKIAKSARKYKDRF